MDALLQRQLSAALAAGLAAAALACALRGRSAGGSDQEEAAPKPSDLTRGYATEPAVVAVSSTPQSSPQKLAAVQPGPETASPAASESQSAPTPLRTISDKPAETASEVADEETAAAAETATPTSPGATDADTATAAAAENETRPLLKARPELIISPTVETAAEGALSSETRVPDSVRTVDLFEEAESQPYQHGTPAPVKCPASEPQPDTLDSVVLPPYKSSTVGIYQPNSMNPSLNVSVSSMNDSSFTAAAKQSFLDGILSDSDDEEEREQSSPQPASTTSSASIDRGGFSPWEAKTKGGNHSEVTDNEDDQDAAAPSPGPTETSFEWPPSNGWGTPDAPTADTAAPAEGGRPHMGGGFPKPLGDTSGTTNVKQLLYERGVAIDTAVEASAAGKFRNVAEVLASSTTQVDFEHVLSAVQEQQRIKAAELQRRQQRLQTRQSKKAMQQNNPEQAADRFQQQLASMLSEARSNAKRNAEATATAFRDLPEFPEEESDDEEYRPTAADLAADAADAATNALEGTVPELPAVKCNSTARSTENKPGKRPNKKKARKRGKAKAKAAAAADDATGDDGKENRVTLTTSKGKSVVIGNRAKQQGRRIRAHNYR